MKKTLLFISALLFSIVSFADQKVYVGAQGGLAYDGLPNHLDKSINFAGRIFAGYNFTQNLAIESGMLFTDSQSVKKRLNGVPENLKFRQQILDVSGRINVPLDSKFIMYTKGGVACIDYFEKGTISKKENLTYGLGLDYVLNSKMSLGISWNHYNGGSKKPIDIIYRKYQPSLDFYAISATYNF